MSPLKSLVSPYIEPDRYEEIRNYKYTGGDLSITYKYFFSPFCNYFVNFFPAWVAPNVITVSGFLLNLTYFSVTLYYTGLKGGVDMPSYACYFCAFCYFFYIILDNTDGKQARRTKSSSPLGMLIDHGTDACTTFFISMGLGSILGFNTIMHYVFFWIMITLPFFLSTWEEYHTGELWLPIVHGVSEGAFAIAIVESITGYYGQRIWLQKTNILFGYEMERNTLVSIIGIIGGSMTAIPNVIKVCRFLGKDFGKSLKDCIFYVLLVSSLLSVSFLSNSVIAKDYPKIIILAYGLEFAKIMGLLQMAHIKKGKFKPLYPTTLIPILVNMCHSLIYAFTGLEILCSIDVLIILSLIWNFLSWLHFVYFCSEEMCEILNIKRFSLGKRHEDKKSQ